MKEIAENGIHTDKWLIQKFPCEDDMEVLRVWQNFLGLWSVQRGSNRWASSKGEQVEEAMQFSSGANERSQRPYRTSHTLTDPVKSAQGWN